MFFRRFASTSTLPPTIRQLLSSPGTAKDIQVNGWVKSIRRQKKVSFAVITDGSSAQGLQAVLSDASLSKQFVLVSTTLSATTHAYSRLTNGTSVRLSGRLTESRGPGQDHELKVDSLEVLGECHPEVRRYLQCAAAAPRH